MKTLTTAKIRCLCLLLFWFGATIVAPAAPLSKRFDFDAPDVYPTIDPSVKYYTVGYQGAAGRPMTEVYTVTNGYLEQRTFSSTGNFSFHWPSNAPPTNGGLSVSYTTIMQARLSIHTDRINVNGSAGVYFQAFNGKYRYTAFFGSGGVNILTTNTTFDNVSLNVHGFHTYRMVAPGNSDQVHLFYDGELVYSGAAGTNVDIGVPGLPLNGFGFGDGESTPDYGGDATWDYVEFYQLPQLRIAREQTFDGPTVRVSWPRAFDSFQLQQSSSVGPSLLWMDVDSGRLHSDLNELFLIERATETHRIYRLQGP